MTSRRLSIRAMPVRLQVNVGDEGRCMMKYMFLLYADGRPLAEQNAEEARATFEAYRAATRTLAEAGVLVDCAPLQPVSASTTVRVRDGETLLTDGPAAEIKEHFGGYTIVECADLDEALKWAAVMPAASDGSVEVRPLVPVEVPA
jgi:hypothetical protein